MREKAGAAERRPPHWLEGDQLSLVLLTRSLGPLWRSENVFSLDPAEGMVLLTPDVTPVDDDPRSRTATASLPWPSTFRTKPSG